MSISTKRVVCACGKEFALLDPEMRPSIRCHMCGRVIDLPFLREGLAAIMSEQTQMTVRRATSYADRLRAYKITLDGAHVGSVRARQSVTNPIDPGRHSLVLRIDWCGSEEIPFDAQPGEHITFECGSSLTGWRIFLAIVYVLFRTREYLWLRRAA